MALQGIKICLLRRFRHGGHGAIQPFCRLRSMEPELGIGMVWVIDQDRAASQLLAKGELATGADPLDHRFLTTG